MRWEWRVANRPVTEGDFGEPADFDAVTVDWPHEGGRIYACVCNMWKVPAVRAVFSSQLEKAAGLLVKTSLDKTFPYDPTAPGALAAAQREAIKYVDFTLTMEL